MLITFKSGLWFFCLFWFWVKILYFKVLELGMELAIHPQYHISEF